MRDLFGVHTGLAAAEGDLRRYHVSFWSGDERDDLRTSEALEPLAIVSPEAVDLRLNRITRTRDFVAVLLGGSTRRRRSHRGRCIVPSSRTSLRA